MCMLCNTAVSAEELDAFAGRYMEMLNHGTVIAMVAVGFRTGLFEAMRDGASLTSHELADRAELNERYVREWLGAMTCGGILECDDSGLTFSLPAPRAALLTEGGDVDNIAHLSRYVTMMGFIEDKIVDCFRNGGGVPYSEFPDFHDTMVLDSKQTIVDHLFQDILPLVPGLGERLEDGIEVMDVGCGRGKAMINLAAAFPRSRFTGFDLSAEVIGEANVEARAQGLKNIRFIQRDLSDFHENAPRHAYDLITAFDAIHDQGRPDNVLRGINLALRPGGTFLMQDIGLSSNVAEDKAHPLGTLVYGISCFHCMTVSLAQEGGLGVGAAWGDRRVRQFLREAGFSSMTCHKLEHDIMNNYYIVKH